jgi:hypothetical protein
LYGLFHPGTSGMSFLILRREHGAVYPLGVVIDWLGPRGVGSGEEDGLGGCQCVVRPLWNPAASTLARRDMQQVPAVATSRNLGTGRRPYERAPLSFEGTIERVHVASS